MRFGIATFLYATFLSLIDLCEFIVTRDDWDSLGISPNVRVLYYLLKS